MSEPSDDGLQADDEMRQHSQAPAEGPVDMDDEPSDVPREHAQQPTEG